MAIGMPVLRFECSNFEIRTGLTVVLTPPTTTTHHPSPSLCEPLVESFICRPTQRRTVTPDEVFLSVALTLVRLCNVFMIGLWLTQRYVISLGRGRGGCAGDRCGQFPKSRLAPDIARPLSIGVATGTLRDKPYSGWDQSRDSRKTVEIFFPKGGGGRGIETESIFMSVNAPRTLSRRLFFACRRFSLENGRYPPHIWNPGYATAIINWC